MQYSANKDLTQFGIHFENLSGKEVDALRHMLQSIFRNTKVLSSLDVADLGDQSFVNFLTKVDPK